MLLALIFRSVLICLMPIIVVVLVSQIAIGLIATANEVFDLKASQDIETILIVVLYGIGTDYILFFLFRYRERLREGEEKRAAVAHALERAGEAIASAGGAVIVAFMALVLSSLGIFRSIGPALAIAVAVTLAGRADPGARPIVTRAGPGAVLAVEEVPRRAGGRPVRRGRAVAWAGTPVATRWPPAACSALLALAAFSFNPSFDLGGSSTSGDVESAVALKTLEKGFPAGATDPTTVLLHSTDGEPLGEDALADVRHRPQRGRGRRPGRRAGRRPRTARPRRTASSSRTTRPPTPRSPRSRDRSATRPTTPHRTGPRRWSAGPRRSSWTSRPR